MIEIARTHRHGTL